MGNEMGNNNTSGLREEDNTVQDKSVQEFGHADDLKGQNHVVPLTLDKVSQEKEDPNGRDQKTENKEEDNMKTKGKKSLEDAARTDNNGNKEQNHEVPASEDIYVNEKKTGLASSNLEGVVEPHDHNQKQDEKEQDDSMINVDKEKCPQESGYVEEAKGQDHLVPAAEDKNTHVNETELASREHDGLASPRIEDWKQEEKEQDTNTITEVEETPLQEAASTDETNAEARIVPAGGDEDPRGMETGLVLSDGNGMAYPCAGKQKHDEKEEDGNINDEAEEQSSQEAASTDVLDRQGDQLAVFEDKTTQGNETVLVSIDPEGTVDPHRDNPLDRQGDQLAVVEDKTTQGNETGLVSIDPEGTVDPHSDNPKDHGETGLTSIDPEGTVDPDGSNPKAHEREENNTNAEHQGKPPAKDDDLQVDIEEKNPTIPAAEGEEYNNTEAKSASGDPLLVGDTLDNQPLEGQEQGKLQPPAKSTEVDAKPSEVVGEGSETQPASSYKYLEDHEMQEESIFEENLSLITHHSENQNSMMEDDEGASNSTSDAASSTSYHSLPQEPAVQEPEEHELAKIDNDQLVLECSVPLESEDMIIPSLTCQDQENGFILDSSILTDMVHESVFPDQSPDVRKVRDKFSVEEMAIKEVSSEEKFELKDGDDTSNDLGNKNSIMTDLPVGFEAKCNGELPSEMNSTKNDSPESQDEVILSDETVQNLQVEVSESEDKGTVLSQKATLIKEESENGNSKHSHCQLLYGEDSIEKSNVQGLQEGSKADELDDFQPQFVMNGHQNVTQICLLDISCDSKNRDKDCQFLQPKILDNGHLFDASIKSQNEVLPDNFLMNQLYKEEESEEKKIVEEMIEKMNESNPIETEGSPRKENGKQCLSRSFPIEEAETFLSLSPFLHEKQQQDSDLECKKVQNSNMLTAEVKEETSGEFSITEASVVEFAGVKPLWDLSECSKSTDPVTMVEIKPSVKQSSEQCAIGETQTPEVTANGDCYQRETVGRLSIESNPDNSTIQAQMRKSPSFDIDLRINARAEDSDQTPLLYQDKTTIESFSSRADATDPGKPVANTEYGKNQSQYATDPGKPVANTEYGKNLSQYEAMGAQEKAFTFERSDSEKSKTPFLGFSKEQEEADQMFINPKKQDNLSPTKKTTKVSAKDLTTATTKGKQKRKPRASLFGTCICCATVTN